MSGRGKSKPVDKREDKEKKDASNVAKEDAEEEFADAVGDLGSVPGTVVSTVAATPKAGVSKSSGSDIPVRDCIFVVQSLPKFSRGDAIAWVRMAEAIFATAEGIGFLARFNGIAGLAYLFGHFTEEDRRDLGWLDLVGVCGNGKTLLAQCSNVWRTADVKVTNAMAKFNLLKQGSTFAGTGGLVDWARKVYTLEQSIRDNLDVKLLCCEIVASLPVEGQSFCLARSTDFSDWGKFTNLVQQYQSMCVLQKNNNNSGNSNTSSVTGNGVDTKAAMFADRRRKNNRNVKRDGDDYDEIVCYRCGRVGHMRNDCGYEYHKNGKLIGDTKVASLAMVRPEFQRSLDQFYSDEVDREVFGDDEHG